MNTAGSEWFLARTDGAPPALRARARHFFDAADGSELSARLAAAGQNALVAATRNGADRAVALDLLAADALITLALLAAAEVDPTGLLQTATQLRVRASGAL